MKISENLNRIIMAAYAEANVRRHEFITPEHLLYACLFLTKARRSSSTAAAIRHA